MVHLNSTPPSILPSRDLGTAVKADLRPSPQSRLAVGPAALGHHNPTVCSLACRWQLRSALQANQEFVSIGNPRHPTSPTHPTLVVQQLFNKYFTL